MHYAMSEDYKVFNYTSISVISFLKIDFVKTVVCMYVEVKPVPIPWTYTS